MHRLMAQTFCPGMNGSAAPLNVVKLVRKPDLADVEELSESCGNRSHQAVNGTFDAVSASFDTDKELRMATKVVGIAAGGQPHVTKDAAKQFDKRLCVLGRKIRKSSDLPNPGALRGQIICQVSLVDGVFNGSDQVVGRGVDCVLFERSCNDKKVLQIRFADGVRDISTHRTAAVFVGDGEEHRENGAGSSRGFGNGGTDCRRRS